MLLDALDILFDIALFGDLIFDIFFSLNDKMRSKYGNTTWYKVLIWILRILLLTGLVFVVVWLAT